MYTLDLEDEDFLFQSRKGVNKPITRETAYRVLKELEPKFKLDRVGTHTLRKTFGYHFYKQFNDVVALQKNIQSQRPERNPVIHRHTTRRTR